MYFGNYRIKDYKEACSISHKLIIIFARSEIILNFNYFPKNLYTLYLNNNIQGLWNIYLFLTSTLNFENVQRSNDDVKAFQLTVNLIQWLKKTKVAENPSKESSDSDPDSEYEDECTSVVDLILVCQSILWQTPIFRYYFRKGIEPDTKVPVALIVHIH